MAEDTHLECNSLGTSHRHWEKRAIKGNHEFCKTLKEGEMRDSVTGYP